jgi:DNA mismatch repair protein MutS
MSSRKRSRKPSPSVGSTVQSGTEAIQLSMFKIDDPVLIKIRDQIKDLDINSLTPLQALNLLSDIKSWV